MDWNDETWARMVKEETRLRVKAANLQDRDKPVMAAQEREHAADIRSALEEIERLREPCLPTCIPPGVHDMHCTRAYLTRAITAEAKLAEMKESAKMWEQRERLKTVEVERLREVLSSIQELYDEGVAGSLIFWRADAALRGGGE